MHSYEKGVKLTRSNYAWFYTHWSSEGCFICDKPVKAYFYMKQKFHPGYTLQTVNAELDLLSAISHLRGKKHRTKLDVYYASYWCCGVRCINKYIKEHRAEILVTMLDLDSIYDKRPLF